MYLIQHIVSVRRTKFLDPRRMSINTCSMYFFTQSDINECSSVVPYCSPDATSHNSKGSYGCICKPGFSGDGKECESQD